MYVKDAYLSRQNVNIVFKQQLFYKLTVKTALNEELYSSWDRVHSYIENIKHLYFTQLYNLKELVQYCLNNSISRVKLFSIIDIFDKNLDDSQIVVTDENYEIIKNSTIQYFDSDGIRGIVSD